MGRSARCVATFGAEVSEGTAQLETDELRFRGAFRLAIPLREIREAVAQDGRLDVSFPAGTASFQLGHDATPWANRILHPPTLLDKLGVKPGMRAWLTGMPHASFSAFRAELAEREAHVEEFRAPPPEASPPPDLIFCGASSRADLDGVVALRRALPSQGALWIVFPKGQRHIREMDVLTTGRAAGLYDVKVARFSETHTALKFVIPKSARGLSL